ncbi:hypothetical protein [Arthrobacter sp. V4I6]|uniref:hypothetical protein n=1 Tax=Arthrobacter sp. V4I6 TaxID=3042281 RepID=UPI0027D7AD10|nr:hypothetical protein [Arthrobacter sp. V4I6]
MAFTSRAGNLVPDDTNGGLSSLTAGYDTFVRDRLTGTTERVSVSSAGRQGDGDSGVLNGMGGPSISADGRYVAFDSESTNLVKGDTNNTADVFVHDRVTKVTTRVSVASGGAQAGGGENPDISADGRYVAFYSYAEDLVPSDTNFAADIFVHDRQASVTERISQTPEGSDANGGSYFTPQLSEDGSFVYFSSFASNLVPGAEADTDDVDAFLYNRGTGVMSAVTTGRGNPFSFVTLHGLANGISNNGRFLTFTTKDDGFISPDTNGFNEDAWHVDTATGEYTLVSVNDTGEQGDELTFAGDVSDDGRYVALVSRATNFGGPEDFRENIYLRDIAEGTTEIVSVSSDGTFGDGNSLFPSMTPSGQVIAFDSQSSLVPDDGNTFRDAFVRDMRLASDIALTMTDSPDPVLARGQVTYTVTLQNHGPGGASGLSMTDTLPDAIFVSASSSQGSCQREGSGKSGGILTCDLGSLAASGTATVTIVVNPAKAGTISNTATARANQPDPDSANNTATETTTVISAK